VEARRAFRRSAPRTRRSRRGSSGPCAR
jgi:hypothetical protein